MPVAATDIFVGFTGAFVVSGRSRGKDPCSEAMVFIPADSWSTGRRMLLGSGEIGSMLGLIGFGDSLEFRAVWTVAVDDPDDELESGLNPKVDRYWVDGGW